MSDRDKYPNLPADVSIHHCTKDHPMNIDGKKATELKQLWIHDDAEETQESKEIDGSFMILYCSNCKFEYSVFLGS